MSSILLVRHGQASFGAADYDALSSLGSQQGTVLGQALVRRGVRPDLVVSGRMERHRQTAAACLGAMQRPPDCSEDRGWDEYDHVEVLARLPDGGAHPPAADLTRPSAGDPKRAFQARFERAVGRWTSGLHDDEYREPWNAFTARVESALGRLAGQLGRSQTALVFTSGGVISVVCRKLLALPDASTLTLNWTIANASVTKLLVGSGGMRLSTFNEHAHFEGAQSALLSYR